MTTTALRTQLQAQGFDRSYISPPREGRGVTVRCSQCEASVINQVSRSGAYCEDCS